MANTHFTIELTKWPEVIAAIRQEIVKALCQEADADADPRVARRLRDVALRFEIGLTVPEHEDDRDK